jgi:hypothetical protein
MDRVDKAEHLRNLLDYPSVVVAYFHDTASVQATLTELRGLGLPANNASVIGASTPAAPEAPPPATGWLQRLTGLFGRPQATVAPVQAPAPPDSSTVVIQAIGLPVATIEEVCRRHGAHRVDSRGALHTATQSADDKMKGNN